MRMHSPPESATRTLPSPSTATPVLPAELRLCGRAVLMARRAVARERGHGAAAMADRDFADAVVAAVRDVDGAVGAARDEARVLELGRRPGAVRKPRHATREGVHGAVRHADDPDAVVECVRDDDVDRLGTDGYALWFVERGLGAGAVAVARLAHPCTSRHLPARGDLADPVVARVGNVQVALGVARDLLRQAELRRRALAAAPWPSWKPASPLPAKVVTAPPADPSRMTQPSDSDTKVPPPGQQTMPAGLQNLAAEPRPSWCPAVLPASVATSIAKLVWSGASLASSGFRDVSGRDQRAAPNAARRAAQPCQPAGPRPRARTRTR